jgi:hypothetical protein
MRSSTRSFGSNPRELEAHSVGSVVLPDRVRRIPTLWSLTTARCVLLVSLVALAAAAKGLGDETAVSLQGDMPRYMMNGAFFSDALRDAPVNNPLQYAYEYFARYPALSIGHHAVLVSMAVTPSFLLFGMSVLSARLTILAFVLLCGIAAFRLFSVTHGQRTALLASLLLVTNPMVVDSSRVVLSELPTLALVITTAFFLAAYCVTQKRSHALAFWLGLVLSIYAKHLAAFMIPVYALYYARTFGFRALFRSGTVMAAIVAFIAIAPLIPLTLRFSQLSVQMVLEPSAAGRWGAGHLVAWVKILWTHLLTPPVFLLAGIAVLILVVKRDRLVSLFTVWIVVFFVEILTLGVSVPRFAIYVIPPFCLLAATLPDMLRARRWQSAAIAALVITIGYQTVRAWEAPLTHAGGYETAAEYVTSHPKGDAVMFSGLVDSGYFVFFVRKHDPARHRVVLRADKLLTTSMMHAPAYRNRIATRGEIDRVLQQFGVAYVVIEEKRYPDGPLAWLGEDVKTARFAERLRVPIQSDDPRLRGIDLVVYEYNEFRPAAPGTTLTLDVPLMNRSLAIPFDRLRRPIGR